MKKQLNSGIVLEGAIDTLQIKTDGLIPDVYSDVSDCVNIITKSVNAEQAGIDTVSSIKINPNNLCGIGDILNYHEFEIAFDAITATLGIDGTLTVKS